MSTDGPDTIQEDAATLPLDPAAATVPATERVSLPVFSLDEVRYEREATLGEGGMGVVVVQRDHRIGRRVAMKILRSDASNARSQRRFFREAQLQGQLEHPAIVPVYDLGQGSDGNVFFTMKRVIGVTLHEVISGLRRGNPAILAKFSQRKLLAAFSQVCLAVDFAHSRGVLHRDLKPANIMLGDFGEVYVLDWGIAKVAETGRTTSDPEATQTDDVPDTAPITPVPVEATASGTLVGTLGYMAPEQIRGGELDARADVYALGAILFELLALEPLHQRAHVEAMIASAITGVDGRPSVRAFGRITMGRAPEHMPPPELDEVCVTATAIEAADRYPTARKLQEAVDFFLDRQHNLELRRTAADQHVAAALQAMEKVEHGNPDDLDARRVAMKQFGSMLGLSPNRDAVLAMAKMMRIPLSVLPPEVADAVERGERDRLRQISRLGFVAYTSIWLFLPLLLWVGFTSVIPLIGVYSGITIAAVASRWISKLENPNANLIIIPMAASNIAFAFVSGFLGPLVFVPTIAVVNTFSYTIHGQRRLRIIVLVVGLATFLAPLALELVGVLPPSYTFTDGGMLILPRGLALDPTATLVVLTIAQVFAVVVGLFIVAILRDYIDRAEKATYTYAWHLREWIPDEVKRETDPVNRPRTKPRRAVVPD